MIHLNNKKRICHFSKTSLQYFIYRDREWKKKIQLMQFQVRLFWVRLKGNISFDHPLIH